MHCLARRAGHGAQINQKPELRCKTFADSCVRFYFFLHKETADLALNVLAFDAIVVQHARRAIDRDADFCQIWECIFLSPLCPRYMAPQTVGGCLSLTFFGRRL